MTRRVEHGTARITFPSGITSKVPVTYDPERRVWLHEDGEPVAEGQPDPERAARGGQRWGWEVRTED